MALAAFIAVWVAKRRGYWDRRWPPYPARLPRRESPADANGPEAQSITVAVGDSFWSIADRLVRIRLGRTPADDEVVEPWLALVDANRDRLLDPDDPDLLHPGQVLRLPPP